MPSWKLMEETINLKDRLGLAYFSLTTKQFTNGKYVKKFEKAWSDWLGCKYSLFVSSGSTANFLLIAAIKEKYNLKNGDKVLLPACTWVTNVGPVIQLGLEPIFCDINLSDFSFDKKELERIKKLHPDIKLIFVTHLLGFAAKNSEYQKIFPNAIIVDDVCESHGAKFKNGSKVGSDSLGATFSFYFGHHMTTIEGGMVCTNDAELYDLMKMKRSHGMARESINFDRYAEENPEIQKSFLFITDGYNFRNHELGAILGLSQLKRLDKMIEIRVNNYKMFVDLMIDHENLFRPVYSNFGNSSFCFPLIAYDKDTYSALIDEFKNNGIEYRPIVSGNLLKHPFLKNYSITSRKKINNVDILNDYGVYLGNNHFVGKKHIKLLKEILEKIDELNRDS
jgi:CDP-6-deoxy-D-xylo-4-hexulose-3-dehydrase